MSERLTAEQLVEFRKAYFGFEAKPGLPLSEEVKDIRVLLDAHAAVLAEIDALKADLTAAKQRGVEIQAERDDLRAENERLALELRAARTTIGQMHDAAVQNFDAANALRALVAKVPHLSRAATRQGIGLLHTSASFGHVPSDCAELGGACLFSAALAKGEK